MERLCYSIREAGDMLRISRQSVNRLIADGTLKILRFGKCVRITAESLNALIKNNMLA